MNRKKSKTQNIVIVTGLSGAGMSSVLKTLEDMDFEVLDNLPLSLIGPLLKEKQTGRLAIGVDTRTRGFKADKVLEKVYKIGAKLLFITCDDAVLHKRFTETRRRHPLAKDKPIRIGIKKERALLKDIQAKADIVIDTTELSVHDLRHILEGHFGQGRKNHLTIGLTSFGFRHGLPRESDIVMDVRFLQNPHWIKNLRNKTGLDKAVGTYIRQDPDFELFMHNFTNLLQILLPRYKKEGKTYLTIAVGCTGGKHRSVYIVEKLKTWLKDQGFPASVEHRDIEI